MQIKNKKWLPYLLMAVVAIITLIPELKQNMVIVGVDSLFHMNRFYDTAMQIKTGHYNYFQSLFGFSQSGRIVNPLYGPFFAYLNGFLLLISHSWVKFQIIDSFLIMFVSGSLMYHLSRKFSIGKWTSLITGIMYMLSAPILSWVVGQQFTGWGAAFLPFLLMNIYELMHGRLRVVALSLGVVVLLQVHTLSCIIGCLALLPFWSYGFWYRSDNRKQFISDSLKSVGLTILLSANIWGGMIELMGSNHLMPIAPADPLSLDGIRFVGSNLSTVLNPVYTVMFALVLLYIVFFWKQISIDLKLVSISSLFFLFMSSVWFPWNQIAVIFPSLNTYLQMPKRIMVASYILLFLSVGLILKDRSLMPNWNRAKYGLAILMILPLALVFNAALQNGVTSWKSFEVVQNDYNVFFHIHNGQKLRNDLRSDNLKSALLDVTKSTPDYLPVKHTITGSNYFSIKPYTTYGREIINASLKLAHSNDGVKRYMDSSGEHFVWNNTSGMAKQTPIPLIKYAHSHITLNGKVQTHVSTSRLGRIKVIAKPGRNEVVIGYHSSLWFKLLLVITIIGWLVTGGLFVRRLIKKH